MKKIIWGTLLAICLPVLMIALVGCMEKPSHAPDYGPEIAVQDVNDALLALGESDPETVMPGEFRYYVLTQSIDQGAFAITFDIGRTVTAVRNRPENTYVEMDYIDQIREFKPDQVVTSSEQAAGMRFPKLSAPPELSLKALQEKIRVSSSKQMHPTSEGPRVSYHNLRSDRGIIPIPEGVRARADCGGLPRAICACNQGLCDGFLRVNRVSFDEVVWESSDRGKKTSYSVVVSAEAPYFSQQISLCIQQWIDFAGRVVPVTQCQDVKDFRFGTSSP